jgi:hypothetical protein
MYAVGKPNKNSDHWSRLENETLLRELTSMLELAKRRWKKRSLSEEMISTKEHSPLPRGKAIHCSQPPCTNLTTMTSARMHEKARTSNDSNDLLNGFAIPKYSREKATIIQTTKVSFVILSCDEATEISLGSLSTDSASVVTLGGRSSSSSKNDMRPSRPSALDVVVTCVSATISMPPLNLGLCVCLPALTLTL